MTSALNLSNLCSKSGKLGRVDSSFENILNCSFEKSVQFCENVKCAADHTIWITSFQPSQETRRCRSLRRISLSDLCDLLEIPARRTRRSRAAGCGLHVLAICQGVVKTSKFRSAEISRRHAGASVVGAREPQTKPRSVFTSLVSAILCCLKIHRFETQNSQ